MNKSILLFRLQFIALTCLKVAAFALAVTHGFQLYAQGTAQFARTLAVSGPVTLEVAIPKGEVTIVQGGDDRMVITAGLQANRTHPASSSAIPSVTVEQNGTHIQVRYVYDHAVTEPASHAISVRIEAPRRAEVISSMGFGDLTMVGVDGPVKADTTTGHINISYALNDVSVQVGSGEIDIEAVSGRVRANVDHGNISCTRVPEWVSAETGEGDITLRVVGPSEAKVRKGGGRIDMGGARGTLVATTDTGDLHVKAVPHQDWQLSSASGRIRVEMPESAGFEINAVTKTGNISVQRPDMDNDASHAVMQKVNGGGRRIQIRSQEGNIVIH